MTRGLSPLLPLERQCAPTRCSRVARKRWMVVGLFTRHPRARGRGWGGLCEEECWRSLAGLVCPVQRGGVSQVGPALPGWSGRGK